MLPPVRWSLVIDQDESVASQHRTECIALLFSSATHEPGTELSFNDTFTKSRLEKAAAEANQGKRPLSDLLSCTTDIGQIRHL
jgi:gamma-glutamyltranspeptidase